VSGMVLRCCLTFALLAVVSGVRGEPAPDKQEPGKVANALPAELRARATAGIERGLEFLRATQQPGGGWKGLVDSDPAITALAARCFVQNPRFGPAHPIVRNAVDLILKFREKDGGIYPDAQGLQNYYTSVCLSMLSQVKDPALADVVASAQQFLKTLQWDEGESIQVADPWYGGAGYGNSKRPDLSNTQMMLEALKESGLPPDDPTYRKALTFIQRCQMASESNDQPFARNAREGGFIYSPVNGGESKAGTVVIQGRPQLRCYGSMTYAGFKSMLYAGVDRQDPRVKQALDWIARYYTLDQNPNMPSKQAQEGLYYYYHVFAKALHAWGEPEIPDQSGIRHNWRADLCSKLLAGQNSDGSWHNPADRWHEGNPVYVTSLAILSLQTALQP
jgi:squalene-hopene/tetraprenyl-beta-curcumene cyclase